ncbi:S1C family serine protease [Ornithinibacillus californiensis]|uniref:S1C family serine protease n=1 Tax=Ornithinibacillus californiensis TaxID=161536 RepID=UPI00064DC33C|nr:trypsin-like peptidase domain-containing protein [Ornithinibacillus californiensis]
MLQKKKKFPIIVSIIISVVGIASLLFMYFSWQSENVLINNPIIKKVQSESETVNLKTIVHEAEKNVVQIEAKNEYQTLTGSGFLYNEKGDIITNAHVIQNAETIYVRTANARVYPAAVIGIGDKTDIAVIRVPQLAGMSGLAMDTDALAEIGDEVIALGSPHGFQNTVTLGIISGSERNFTVDGYDYNNAYQISAPITHGNSGGPLINRNTGKVIGINSVGTEDGTIGFSIPIIDVIQDIETWSNEAQNSQLTFTSTEDLMNSIDPEEIMQDAEYVMEYFLDSIIIRDYVAAYSLLGDSLQSTNSYSSFREDYIQVLDVEYTHQSTLIGDNNHASVLVDIVLTKNQPNEEEQIKENIQYKFNIGYENDQLKIIGIDYVNNTNE